MPTYLEKNEPIFKEQIERLQKGLKGSYTKEQINILFTNIKRFKVDHLTRTVEHLLITKTFLPPVNDIMAGCRVEAYGDELKDQEEEKSDAKRFFNGELYHRKMAKESMDLITDVLTINKEGFFLKPKAVMTKNQLYQKMLILEERYPGRGWKTEANKMVKTPLELLEMRE